MRFSSVLSRPWRQKYFCYVCVYVFEIYRFPLRVMFQGFMLSHILHVKLQLALLYSDNEEAYMYVPKTLADLCIRMFA